MTDIKYLAYVLALIGFSALVVGAQTPRINTVNIAAKSDKVQITAQGDVSEMRVDVADESGEVVFQSGVITGQQLDWNMKDASGERVAAGTYLVTVTFRNAAGKLRKRVEQVTVDEAEKSSTQDISAPQAVQETVTTSNPGVFGSIARFTGASTIANSVISQSTAGKIGIGTPYPTANLHVQSGEGFTPLKLTAGSGAGASTGSWRIQADNGLPGQGAGFVIYSDTAQQYRMIINGQGNVGIGTTRPTSGKLHVEDNNSVGVYGQSQQNAGVYGYSSSRNGVVGYSNGSGAGVSAYSGSGASLIVDGSSALRNLVEGYRYGVGPVFHITPHGAYVTGSDFAEALPARGGKARYEPGDVLVLSSALAGAVEKSTRPFDTRVAGIYSTRPGVIGAEKGGTSRVDPDDLPVAIVGIVPTKVSAEQGSVRVGDLLTTSSTPGYAMRCKDYQKCMGAIVGKALEPLKEGQGVIKVLVMLR